MCGIKVCSSCNKHGVVFSTNLPGYPWVCAECLDDEETVLELTDDGQHELTYINAFNYPVTLMEGRD